MLVKWHLLIVLAVSISACGSGDKCRNSGDMNFAVKDFKKISAGRDFSFTILKGAEFSVKAKGCTTDLSDLHLTVSDSVLDVRFTKYRPQRFMVDFTITTPIGSEVDFFGTTRVRTTKEPGN